MTDTINPAATADFATTPNWTNQIEGRFRRITVQQLCLAWWLYRTGTISMRQLRIYFAAHEMAEKRRYTRKADNGPKGRDRRPLFTTEEVRRLIGGQRSDSAEAALSSDIRELARVGLVSISPHTITFARSIEDLTTQSPDAFRKMLDRIPNNRRSVPMPRRTCRALAAGFGRATTGVMLALLIRSLYWHRATAERAGGYRTDGRTKGSWIADVFDISRRGVTEGRAKLIELGWLEPIATPQWQLNKWGQHDRILVDWSPTKVSTTTAIEEGTCAGESASPRMEESGENATPWLNRSTPSSKETLETRKPAPTRPDPSGSCMQGNEEEGTTVLTEHSNPSLQSAITEQVTGQSLADQEHPQKRMRPEAASTTATQLPTKHTKSARHHRCQAGQGPATPKTSPKLSDIQSSDLRSTERLLELYRQAIAKGWASDSQAGQLDFLALAERARARGRDSAKLFAWLIRNRRVDYITQSDEDAAAHRLREHLFGPTIRQPSPPQTHGPANDLTAWSETDLKVRACLHAASRTGHEPADIALQAWGWTTEKWEKYSAQNRE